MVQDIEGKFKVGEQSLYTRSWLPDGPTKAKLILVHGFSDHVGLYEDFGLALAKAGIAVLGVDQRGWGKSVTKPAERGRTGPTAMVVADIAAFISSHLPASPTEPPVFVLGHSLGGGSVLALASDPVHEKVVERVRGWLLECPFLGWPAGETPSWLKVFSGRLAGRIFPHMHMAHNIPADVLTRDPVWVKRLAEDKLCHDLGTLEGLAGTLDRTNDLSSGKIAVKAPAVKSLWVGHGTIDKAVSYDASKKWFESYSVGVPDRTFRPYEGWFHQLHNDTPKEEYFGHVIEWVLERAAPDAATVPAGAPAAAPAAEASKDGVAPEAATTPAPAVKQNADSAEPAAAAAGEDKPESKL